jgi:hypothetical protein
MEYTRQHVVATLRMAGFDQVADEAMVELPDPVEVERLLDWGLKRGITTDQLTSAMGGSP